MSSVSLPPDVVVEARRGWWVSARSGSLAERLRRLRVLEWVGLGSLAFITIGALLAPVLAPHGETDVVGEPFLSPGSAAWLGTDDQGRDIFSRVILGARATWFSALVVILVSLFIGLVIGSLAGVVGGWLDAVLMRFTDVFLAFPGTLLVIAVVTALGPGLRNTLVAVMIVFWPFYARIVRGQVRAVMARSHVEAARMAGIGRTRLVTSHVLPGILGPLLVAASLDIGGLIVMLSGLSFLGLGSQPPSPELGSMTQRGLQYLFTNWWIPIFPALVAAFLAFCGNLAGDATRDIVEG